MAVHSAAIRRRRRRLTLALTAALAAGPGAFAAPVPVSAAVSLTVGTFAEPDRAEAARVPGPDDRQLTVGGPGVLLDLQGPATLGFRATAGQRLTVLARRRTLTAADNTDLTIVRNGATVAEGTLITTWASAGIDFTAPAAGAYTVRIAPRAAKDRGTLLVSLAGASFGTLTLRGPARKVTIAEPGERAFLTFPATAGQRLTLVARRGSLSKDEYTNLDIRGPSGELSTSGAVGYESDYRTLDFDVTETGRHTVEVNPDTDRTGTLTVQLTGSVAAVLTPGRPTRITFGQPGERAFVTFRAAEAEQFRLTARPGTLTTVDDTVLKVRTPAGLDVVDATLTAAEPVATLGFSSSAGLYTIEIDPQGLDIGTLTLDLRRMR
ncbi:hypothetical protein [Actinoplanes sp. CA-252034]|uniref:hypothetical protein n=1 Tax=Actinoplanes sp. CA-252034 TaxID=3239906 RepID=UPI003D973567